MPVFRLVTDVEKVVESWRVQYGEFVFAMLYNGELGAESNWNLIVSAPWTDQLGVAESTHLIARTLNQKLGLENQRAISRVTVLKTSDPFVQDMTHLYSVAPGARTPVHQITAGGVTEGSGFILYSQVPATT